MIHLNKLIEKSNAERTSIICSSIHPVLFVRYEALAEFLSEEPQFVIAKFGQNQEQKIIMEQVLRVRLWKQTGLVSWQLFLENRTLQEGTAVIPIVIRELVWEKDRDILKNLNKEDRKELLYAWPEVDIKNHYLEIPPDSELFGSLASLDLTMLSGIQFDFRDSNIPEWTTSEIMRLYEWGKVNITWSNEKKHHELEERIVDLIDKMCFPYESSSIPEIILDYSILPEEFKKIVTGSM